MAEYRLTRRAESDLSGIANYTIETFGIEQARRYRDQLEGCFEKLAQNSRLGRSANALRRACGASNTVRIACSTRRASAGLR